MLDKPGAPSNGKYRVVKRAFYMNKYKFYQSLSRVRARIKLPDRASAGRTAAFSLVAAARSARGRALIYDYGVMIISNHAGGLGSFQVTALRHAVYIVHTLVIFIYICSYTHTHVSTYTNIYIFRYLYKLKQRAVREQYQGWHCPSSVSGRTKIGTNDKEVDKPNIKG